LLLPTGKESEQMDRFFNYFDQRYRDSILSSHPASDGPVITISRQTGCDAREVALRVADRLNTRLETTKWRWVDKDIIYSIAKDLNIDYGRVESFYEGMKLNDLSEMIMAFSGGFVSDLRVKKAIKEVVLSICKEGNIVLVGRGGVSIARGIRDSLHVRIVAPFNWRMDNVMRKKNMTSEAAGKYIVETDAKRNDLIRVFLEKNFQDIDSLFDVTINRMLYSINDISDVIVSMFEKKVVGNLQEKKRIGSYF
jgi:cytidylate kinase